MAQFSNLENKKDDIYTDIHLNEYDRTFLVGKTTTFKAKCVWSASKFVVFYKDIIRNENVVEMEKLLDELENALDNVADAKNIHDFYQERDEDAPVPAFLPELEASVEVLQAVSNPLELSFIKKAEILFATSFKTVNEVLIVVYCFIKAGIFLGFCGLELL